MRSSGRALVEAAEATKPSIWLTLSQMLGTAMLGALLVAAGQVSLNRILPPSELQQNADYMVNLWKKASESEKKLLNQIISRPAR
jgi:hypothetical protein